MNPTRLLLHQEQGSDDRGHRMNQVMEKLKILGEKDCSSLVRILFGLELPTSISSEAGIIKGEPGYIDFMDHTLNESQREAVRFALASQEIALIHGPPGVRSKASSKRQ